jgi:hypothetical protein
MGCLQPTHVFQRQLANLARDPLERSLFCTCARMLSGGPAVDTVRATIRAMRCTPAHAHSCLHAYAMSGGSMEPTQCQLLMADASYS